MRISKKISDKKSLIEFRRSGKILFNWMILGYPYFRKPPFMPFMTPDKYGLSICYWGELPHNHEPWDEPPKFQPDQGTTSPTSNCWKSHLPATEEPCSQLGMKMKPKGLIPVPGKANLLSTCEVKLLVQKLSGRRHRLGLPKCFA